MMPTNYGGKSMFFDSPAGKALSDLSVMPDDGGDLGVGPAGGMFATMRPSLRNALSDKYGEEMLSELERRPMQRWQQSERALQETNPMYRESAAWEDALLGADLADFGGERTARRYFDPMTAAMRSDQYGRQLKLATEPARIAADSRAEQAAKDAAAKVQAAQATASGRLGQVGMNLLPELVKAGAFGRDRRGNVLQPDAATLKTATEAISRILAGSGVGPGGQQAYSPDIEKLIQQGVDAGATREEAIGWLQANGYIR